MEEYLPPLENLLTNNNFNMHKRLIIILAHVFVIFVITASCSKNKPITLRFLNPLKIDRINEVVSINYNHFSNEAGDLPAGMLPLFLDGEDTLVSQNIDLNTDGTPEEILVEISLIASGKKDIRIAIVPKESFPVFPEKTNLHFARLSSPGLEIDSASRIQTIDTKVTASVFQMEGPAWENDKVAFRNYFDLRNGIDIYGKKIDLLVMDTIGLPGHTYHEMRIWGMDILKVGTSLGAGAIGLDKAGKLCRIGDNGKSHFERIYEGPLKSEFAFHFDNWKAGKDSFNIIHYISITAGLYRYESEIFADWNDTSCLLIAGIVNKHSDSLIFEPAGENHVLLATHAIQSEDTALLGMALLIPRNLYKSHNEAPKTGTGITETYYAKISASMNEPAHYYFYAGWATGNPMFRSKEKFLDLIKEDALKLENPIHVQKVILP
jgi:hypothetical protein